MYRATRWDLRIHAHRYLLSYIDSPHERLSRLAGKRSSRTKSHSSLMKYTDTGTNTDVVSICISLSITSPPQGPVFFCNRRLLCSFLDQQRVPRSRWQQQPRWRATPGNRSSRSSASYTLSSQLPWQGKLVVALRRPGLTLSVTQRPAPTDSRSPYLKLSPASRPHFPSYLEFFSSVVTI
jgi:hypothetical protein